MPAVLIDIYSSTITGLLMIILYCAISRQAPIKEKKNFNYCKHRGQSIFHYVQMEFMKVVESLHVLWFERHPVGWEPGGCIVEGLSITEISDLTLAPVKPSGGYQVAFEKLIW